MNGGKDRWDKAQILGSLALPTVVAVVGIVLTALGASVQREFSEINARATQASAITSLLDALTEEDCVVSTRKAAAIRLVYHVLEDDEEAANELLLAVQGSAPGGSCATLASQVFQSRLAQMDPELSEAVAVLLSTAPAGDAADSDAPAAGPASVSAEVRVAAETLRSSRYASLVIPAVTESALAVNDERVAMNVGELLQDETTWSLAKKNPHLAAVGEAFLSSDTATDALGDSQLDVWNDRVRR